MAMKKSIKTAFVLAFCVLVPLTSWANDIFSTKNKALTKTHTNIVRDYEIVEHINSEELSQMDNNNYILFDVRERDEFVISHIDGAIWVNPSMEVDEFIEKYSEQIVDKTLILYCSVGVRSSRLAEKLLKKVASPIITQVYNLENGLFGWHNESRPLIQKQDNSEKNTDYIHPYNFIWGRMINRKELKRYNPE